MLSPFGLFLYGLATAGAIVAIAVGLAVAVVIAFAILGAVKRAR